MSKYLHLLLWAMLTAVFLCFLAVGLITYWLFWPYKTLVVKNFSYTNPIHITTPTVHPGDALEYTLDYCKYLDAPAIVYKTMVDGQVIPLAPKASDTPVGCRSASNNSTVVPETINPGRYYLDVTLVYKPNPIRTIDVHYYTDYFQVVPDDEPSTSMPATTTAESKLIPSVPLNVSNKGVTLVK